jgi:enoyl-CoA hydratase/carnithine racemase
MYKYFLVEKSRLVKTLGTSIAKKVILTSEEFEAKEALRLGLVDNVYPQEELESI